MWWRLKLWICTNLCFQSGFTVWNNVWVLLVYCSFIGSLLKHLTLDIVIVVPLVWHWLNMSITLSNRGSIHFSTLSSWFVNISSIDNAAAEAIRLNYNYQTINSSSTRCLFCLALVRNGDGLSLRANLWHNLPNTCINIPNVCMFVIVKTSHICHVFVPEHSQRCLYVNSFFL